MKKQIEVVICDICETEDNVNKDNGYVKCSICGKDVCGDCHSDVFSDVQFFPITLYVCDSCVDSDKIERVLNKFFKSKEAKEELDKLSAKLQLHLKKLAILNNVSDDGTKSGDS